MKSIEVTQFRDGSGWP